MIELLQSLEPWHWWVFAVGLLILEAMAPGAIFLWLGIAAGFVGIVLWAIPAVSWETQLVLFAVISVVDVAAWRMYRKRYPAPGAPLPLLNRRMDRYVGNTLTLDQPIVNGDAQVRMNDTVWQVTGPDLPAGTRVKITGYKGPVLIVEPAE